MYQQQMKRPKVIYCICCGDVYGILQCFVCFQVHRFFKTKIKPWYFSFDKYNVFFSFEKYITCSFQPENRNVQALSDEVSSVIPQLS